MKTKIVSKNMLGRINGRLEIIAELVNLKT